MSYILTRQATFNLKIKRRRRKLFPFLNLFLLFVLSIFYTSQVISLAKNSYLQKIYQEKITKLEEENNFLEIQFSKLDSPSTMEKYLKERFVKKTPEEVKYTKIINASFAAR